MINKNSIIFIKLVYEGKMEIYEYLQENVPIGWEDVFKESMVGIKSACKHLKEKNINYGPAPNLVFRAYQLVPPEKVKVVIFGMNPYPTADVANGLCFSSNRNYPVQASLKRIYLEIKNNIPEFVTPQHGDLTAWAQQGVLLLNKSLTVKIGFPKDHLHIWMNLITTTINHLSNNNKNIIWIMWGGDAQKLDDIIGEKGIKLKAAHPSPTNTYGGFLGCGHFKEINRLLTEKGMEPINWNLD